MLMDFIKDVSSVEKINNNLGFKSIDDCLRFPKYFLIETVGICNAECIMCPLGKFGSKDVESKLMTNELFQKFVDEFKDYTDWINSIALYNVGEPTLDKHIVDKIRKLKDIGIKNVNISTNASILDEKLSIELINSGLDEILFSIDSNKKEVYEKTRVGLNFDDVFNNILRFIELRNKLKKDIIIRVRMVELKETQDEVAEWLKFWKSKANGINDRVYTLPNHYWANQVGVNDDAVQMITPCISPFSTMIIHYDGNVSLCCADFDSKYPMGNTNEATIKEIWTSTEFNDIRELHLRGSRNSLDLCKECSFWSRQFE